MRRRILLSLTVVLCGLCSIGCSTRAVSAPDVVPAKPQWSLGIVSGDSPYALSEALEQRKPCLTAADISTPKSQFVADPFLVREGKTYFLFFELFNERHGRGELGVAESTNLTDWSYKGVVLAEPFHLSYPFVFKERGSYYMIPESRAAGEVRLYKAVSFPTTWKHEKTLLRGQFVDSSLVRFKEKWWLFSGLSPYSLSIFYANSIRGPWKAHAQNPVYRDDNSRARPAGRPIVYKGDLIRFVQDNREGYGKKVRAMKVDVITAHAFSEHPLEPDPFLSGGGTAWRSNGMHHISPLQLSTGEWVAAVDGSGDARPD